MIAESLRLMLAILSLHGDGSRTVRPSDAARASLAITVTRGDWPAELVAVIAVRESSMRWAVNPRSGACGPGQILASHDRARQARFCARLHKRGVVAWYAAITRKLDDARDVCERLHRRDVVACAVAGYVGGMPAVMNGRRKTARAILKRADELAIAMLVSRAPAKGVGLLDDARPVRVVTFLGCRPIGRARDFESRRWRFEPSHPNRRRQPPWCAGRACDGVAFTP